MPYKTLFRVWDVFFVDGLDVLFRIAMAILRNNEAELLRCESIPAVYVSLENLPTRMWEADKLLQVCGCLYSHYYTYKNRWISRSLRQNFALPLLTLRLPLDERHM